MNESDQSMPAHGADRIPFGRGDVEVAGDETVYDGFFKVSKLTLRHRQFRGGWSGSFTREVFRRRDAVGVLLYDPQRDAVALVEQFRVGAYAHGAGPWLLEVVAGVVDPGESPAGVAVREAQEEAGCAVTALEPVAGFFPSPGGSDEYFHLFCGRCDLGGAGGVHGLAEEHEDIRVQVMDAAELEARLARGELRNALTLVAAHWFRQHRERLRAQWR